jgi:hypothetical protein
MRRLPNTNPVTQSDVILSLSKDEGLLEGAAAG